MEQEEPWGLNDEDPRYQPVTEDITVHKDDESDPMLLKLKQKRQAKMVEDEMSKRQKGTYRCDRCEFATADFMSFITHKNAHMEKEKKMASHFTCGMCEFATTNPVQMAEHIQAHLNKEPWKVSSKSIASGLTNGVASDDKENNKTADGNIVQVEVAATEDKTDSIETLEQASSTPEEMFVSNQEEAPETLEENTADEIVEVDSPTAEPKALNGITEDEEPETRSKIEVSLKVNEPNEEIVNDVDEPLPEHGDPPLKWVSVADVHKQRDDTDLAAEVQEVESVAIADESLIGYLELRRVKPIKTTNKTTNPIEKPSPPLPKPSKQEDAADLQLSPVKEFENDLKKPVLVKFCASKKRVIATDKGVKTIKERKNTFKAKSRQQASLKSHKTSINAAKPTVSPKKGGKNSAQPVLGFRSTRSNVSQASSFEFLERTPKKSVGTKAQTNVTEAPRSPSKPAKENAKESIQTSDVAENGMNTDVVEQAESTVKAKNDQEKQSPGVVTREDSVDDVASSSPSDNQESQAHIRFHRKPKTDILLRYQNEQNMEATPESYEKENAFEHNKVLDLVTQPFDVKLGFQKAKVIRISTDDGEIEKYLDDEVEKGHLCQIVLSRCSTIDHMAENGKPNIAKKLKSTLRDCWQKVLKKGTSPEQKTSGTTTVKWTDQFLTAPKKRKLEMPDMPNPENEKRGELKKPYRCPLCEFSAVSKEDLFAHSHQQHTEEETMYICEKCGYITSRLSKLTSHQKIHCGSSASSEENKNAVSVAYIADEPLIKKSKMLDNLPAENNTAVLSNNDQPKSCKQTVSLGRQSMDRQNGQPRLFSCKTCSYSSNRLFNLKVHERAHSGTVKQYKCKHCSFAASRWGQYIEHQFTHKSNSELCCYEEQCSFTTSDPQVLKSHRLLHKVVPELLCNFCNYTTFRKDLLDKHYSRVHSDLSATNGNGEIAYRTNPIKRELPFKCVICWYSARDSKTLAKHMQIHAKANTPKKFKCGSCDFRTNFEFALRRHERHSKSCGTVQNKINV